ncbi:ABC transporter permease [Cellulosilyticum sp. ST5]|uniref:ABC transporter permease n=1 Tax=unclassified Cellulosilyticum TaxID=2643091 RepID=UPI000F8D2066|nr:ABC transporter permease [Cellulosilyticum sp. WCF-2]QEH68797.1 ABC transporter permease [Cellulosilyticum sp. WCF-2]
MNKKGLISIIAMVLGLLAGALLMFATGHNAFEGFLYLIQGGTKSIERIGNTIATATPLVLTGLSVAFAFRTGLFNIGTPGQMLFGGFCATIVGQAGLNLPRPIYLLVIILVALIGGALWAFIPGLLKAIFNVHEVVSCIMMNWIAYWIIYYGVQLWFPNGSKTTESLPLANALTLRSTWLSDLFGGSYINLGIIVAIVATLIIALILNKTTFGYELKAVGFNKHAAEYAGISVNKSIIYSLMIAGGLAGLAGLTQYAGVATNMQIGIMPSQGFDGIAVSLLGANTPIGAFFSALFFGLLYAGRGFMSVMTDVPPEIADTIIATIIYFAATSVLVERFLNKVKPKKGSKNTSNIQTETKDKLNNSLIPDSVKESDNGHDSIGLLPPNDSNANQKGDE